MAVEVTTVTVHPERAEGIRRVRDERGLKSMDAAIKEMLEEVATE